MHHKKNGPILSSVLLIVLLSVTAFLCSCSSFRTSPEEAEVTPEPVSKSVEVVPVELVAASTATPEPVATVTPSPSPTPEPVLELKGFVIGVDPGHQLKHDGSKEPFAPGASTMKEKVAGGCKGVNSKVFEYEVNLNVGLALRDLLEANGATVVMTHSELDVNISNSDRAKLFNENNVDIGIRIHCDKNGNSTKRGVHMLVPKDYRTDWYDDNVRAARCVLDCFSAVTGLPVVKGDGISERGDQTGFNWCTRPVIGIEMGYLSNAEDDALLSDPSFQKICAQGLYEGLRAYLLNIDTTGYTPLAPGYDISGSGVPAEDTSAAPDPDNGNPEDETDQNTVADPSAVDSNTDD